MCEQNVYIVFNRSISENRLQRTVKVISVTFAVFQLSSSLFSPVYASAMENMALKSVTLLVSQASSNWLNDCVAKHKHTEVHTSEKTDVDSEVRASKSLFQHPNRSLVR